jgi:multicomponent Na+:H+ antiporter subunit D
MAEALESALLPWPVVVPLLGAALCFVWKGRPGRALGGVFALGTVVAVARLVAGVWAEGPARHTIGGWPAPLGIGLYADGLAAVLLGTFAVVGAGISAHALGSFEQGRTRDFFWPLWLMVWAALNAVVLSADLFNLYVCFELLGLSAVALVTLGGGTVAFAAGMRYLLASLLGSLGFLMGVALLYAQHGVLDLGLLAQAPPAAGVHTLAVGLLFAGLAVKTALVPLHGWLPLAHASAPAPASAALSALVVKASFYVLLRLHLALLPGASAVTLDLVLAALGTFAIVWGSWLALRQSRLKLVIAYSTVAQLGYLFLCFSLAQGRPTPQALQGAVYLMLSHAFAKAAAFLAAGNVHKALGTDELGALRGAGAVVPGSVLAFGIAGMSLMGLPPSGGFIAKWLMLRSAILGQQWFLAVVIATGGLLAAGYVIRVLGRTLQEPPARQLQGRHSLRDDLPALALALAALLLGFASAGPLAMLEVGAPLMRAGVAGP